MYRFGFAMLETELLEQEHRARRMSLCCFKLAFCHLGAVVVLAKSELDASPAWYIQLLTEFLRGQHRIERRGHGPGIVMQAEAVMYLRLLEIQVKDQLWRRLVRSDCLRGESQRLVQLAGQPQLPDFGDNSTVMRKSEGTKKE